MMTKLIIISSPSGSILSSSSYGCQSSNKNPRPPLEHNYRRDFAHGRKTNMATGSTSGASIKSDSSRGRVTNISIGNKNELVNDKRTIQNCGSDLDNVSK